MRTFLDFIETRYLKQLPQLLGAICTCIVALFLLALTMQSRQARPTGEPVTDTATVVVFETADCEPCDSFRKLIGRPHQGSDLGGQVPLRYFDISDGKPPKRFLLARGVDGGPTAVVFDIYGRERARVDWMPKDLKDFQEQLLPHVRRASRDWQLANAGRPRN